MAQKDPVIEVQGLVVRYGERLVLKGVDLSVNEGEIMVVMGGSGSGKSTLLRHLLGLQRPAAGCVRMFGNDIGRLSSREMQSLRRNIGVAFQGGALFGWMNLEDNIKFPLREHTDLDESIIRIMARMKLEVVGLSGFEDLMPSQLSGGMVKRAALARALALDPALLFFDEPTSGLDRVAAVELDELILELRDAMKMTIVVITHELESALKIADRITVLDDGAVLMTGTDEEVKQSPNEKIQGLMRRLPRQRVVDTDAYLRRLTGGGS